MTWTDRLDDLADDVTIERGRRYAASGRVIEIRAVGDRITAGVAGTQEYRVELTSDTWFCDCPVGVTGEFCKHCVAVTIEATGDGDQDAESVDLSAHDGSGTGHAGSGTGHAAAWFEGLSAHELRTLLAEAIVRVDGMAEFVARTHVAATDDLAALARDVKQTFTPRRRFYDYRAANDYASEVEPTVQWLIDRAERPASAAFLTILQTAIDQTVRTILRSDDSSGLQGGQTHRLLQAHAQAASMTTLDRADAKKLVKWLYTFRFGGKQDFFEIDIDRYAGAVGGKGVADYRRLVDAAAAKDPTDFAVRYARGRLAILSKDQGQIVAHFGADLAHAYSYVELVGALTETGHSALATEFARRGVTADPRSPYVGPLVEHLVDDARKNGATDEVLRICRDDFTHRPSTATYTTFARAAQTAGTWAADRTAADELLVRVDVSGLVHLMHKNGEDDAAWATAEDHAGRIDVELWQKLLRKRVKTVPESALPHYRRMVDEVLAQADRRNYRTAVRLLRDMRRAAQAADRTLEFVAFFDDVVERNRRRPSFGEELRRAGLTS